MPENFSDYIRSCRASKPSTTVGLKTEDLRFAGKPLALSPLRLQPLRRRVCSARIHINAALLQPGRLGLNAQAIEVPAHLPFAIAIGFSAGAVGAQRAARGDSMKGCGVQLLSDKAATNTGKVPFGTGPFGSPACDLIFGTVYKVFCRYQGDEPLAAVQMQYPWYLKSAERFSGRLSTRFCPGGDSRGGKCLYSKLECGVSIYIYYIYIATAMIWKSIPHNNRTL